MTKNRLTVFYDNKKQLQNVKSAFPGAQYIFVKDVPKKDALVSFSGESVAFALHNNKLQAVTANLSNIPFCNVFVLPGGIGEHAKPVKIDFSKPRLDYIETEISRFCNLNCRGCCDFSNLAVDGEKFYDFDRYRADLNRLKELFWGIAKIRIMGGEPLLNPRFADYAEEARKIFPDCDLRIVTNGLMLPSVSKETLKRLKDIDCSFDISNYPPTAKKKSEIVSVLSCAGVSFNFSVPMRYFFKNLREKPAPSPAPAFNNCIFTHCHMLGDGKLSPCSFAFCSYRFNRRFEAHYPENDYFDIYDPALDGQKITDTFSKPHEFCRYCGSGIIPIKWQGNCPSKQAKESDWQIKDNFVNSALAPKLQSALKKSAMVLRAKNQKKD